MSDTSRRQRFGGRLKRLLDICIETRNVQAGLTYAKMIMQLENWIPSNSRDDQQDHATPSQGPDMTSLLQHISGANDGKQG